MVTSYLTAAEAARLRERAAESDRSVAAEIRVALRGHLENDASPTGRPGSVNDSAVERPPHAPA